MIGEKLRLHFGDYLGQAEVVVDAVLALLLFVISLATIADAGKLLGEDLIHWTIAFATWLVLDQLPVVLTLVETLHKVRISLRSHILSRNPSWSAV